MLAPTEGYTKIYVDIEGWLYIPDNQPPTGSEPEDEVIERDKDESYNKGDGKSWEKKSGSQ